MWRRLRFPAEHVRQREAASCRVVGGPHITVRYGHVTDMAKRNPGLFMPVKVG